jgi:hypothetical protein
MNRLHIVLVSLSVAQLCSTECGIAADKAAADKVFADKVAGDRSDATAVAPMAGANAKVATTSYGSHLVPILLAIHATPDQKKQISEIVEDFRPKIQPLKLKYKEAQSGFLSAMVSARAPEEVMLKQSELNELYIRIVNEYCVMNLRIRKLLNASQCQKYEEYRSRQGWSNTPK